MSAFNDFLHKRISLVVKYLQWIRTALKKNSDFLIESVFMENPNIRELLNHPIDDLLFEIGKDISKQNIQRRGFPPTKPELIELAEKYLAGIWDELKQIICDEKNRQWIDKNQKEVAIVGAISDLIASVVVGISR